MKANSVKRLTIRQRILASFGIILALMLVMAALSYAILRGIDHDANSLQEDTMLGTASASDLRAAWTESYATAERLAYIDDDPEQTKRDTQLLAESRTSIEHLMD